MIATEAAAPGTNPLFVATGKLNGKQRTNWNEQVFIRTSGLSSIYALRKVASFRLRNAATKVAWFLVGTESTTNLDLLQSSQNRGAERL